VRAPLEVADVFRRHGGAYRQAHEGPLSRVERKVMGAIEACRTATLGGHVEHCMDCGLVRQAYNSCRNRHCPKCQGLAPAAPRARWGVSEWSGIPEACGRRHMRARRDQERIRALNDQMRADGPEGSGSNHWVVTRGVTGLGIDEVRRAIEAVRSCDKFDDDNDPYGEHDLGALEFAGHRLFWKIDYYALGLAGGSPDPSDPSVTARVLTIMLWWEY